MTTSLGKPIKQDRVGNHFLSTLRLAFDDGGGAYETALFLLDGTELEVIRNSTQETALEWHQDVLESLELLEPIH